MDWVQKGGGWFPPKSNAPVFLILLLNPPFMFSPHFMIYAKIGTVKNISGLGVSGEVDVSPYFFFFLASLRGGGGSELSIFVKNIESKCEYYCCSYCKILAKFLQAPKNLCRPLKTLTVFLLVFLQRMLWVVGIDDMTDILTMMTWLL